MKLSPQILIPAFYKKQHKVFSVLVLLKIYPIVLSTNISAYGLMAVTN
ncbi:Uncharacterised protein [Vibrio cholerae]|nr:Uncharacterised protein [Vibrio cholerae]